jgi:steroid delta-isomerase-like uncharacterized protein
LGIRESAVGMTMEKTGEQSTEKLIRDYYAAFNAHDWNGMLALLTDDVAHDISQGGRETGRDAFKAFMAHMDRSYRESVRELVVMVAAGGTRAAAEFELDGEYLATDGNFPPAKGQRYTLRVGAFFDVKGGKIARVSNHYNLKDWLAQVK